MDLGWVRTAARLLPARPPSRSPSRPGFGKVSAEKLVNAIEASKQQPFGRVLFALGIEEVGYVTGRNLAQQFRTRRRAARPPRAEEIEQTQGVGPKMAQSIHDQLADDADARADRGPARGRGCSSRRRGRRPARARWPARRSCSPGRCPNLTREQATEMIVGRRRPRHRLGVAQDRLRRRRRERRARSSRRPSGSGCAVLDEAGAARHCSSDAAHGAQPLYFASATAMSASIVVRGVGFDDAGSS